MKVKIGILLAVAALAVVAAGTARAADAPASADSITIACGDGTVWVVDATDVDSFGDVLCGGDYSVQTSTDSADEDGGSVDSSFEGTGGSDVGLSADPNIAPDPTQYISEVQCPNGQIWAVAIGDAFVCPAS